MSHVGLTINTDAAPSLSVQIDDSVSAPKLALEFQSVPPALHVEFQDEDNPISCALEAIAPVPLLTLDLASECPKCYLDLKTDNAPNLFVGELVQVGGGEANTASNVEDSSGAEGLFRQKVGLDLEFRSLRGAGGITVYQSAGGNEVILDGRTLVYANCLLSDAVGNCVYITSDRSGGLYQVTTVDIEILVPNPAVGIIIEKTTDTDCVVQLHGILDGLFSGMTPNKVQWVDFSGSLTESLPSANLSPGYVWTQSMGQAIADDVLMLNPNHLPTKRLYRP